MVALKYKHDHVIVNKYSRPGDPLLRVQAIVIHYTANPDASALMHANFFDGEDGGAYRYAGAHIFVDRKEALELIPLNEVGYHANERKAGPLIPALKASADYYPRGNANLLTIGIEMCIEKDGSFHPDTIERTRLVVQMLQAKFPQLADTKNRVVRHYDITGKICPKPFVENPTAWANFLASIDRQEMPQAVVKAAAKATWKPVSLANDKFGIYDVPATKWRESATKYLGWVFVARKEVIANGERWYELFIGDKSYGWASESLVKAIPFRWANIGEDSIGYVHADMKVPADTMSKGARIAILSEGSDKYMIISHNRPQWIAKKIVE